jgi:hypothetical protein
MGNVICRENTFNADLGSCSHDIAEYMTTWHVFRYNMYHVKVLSTEQRELFVCLVETQIKYIHAHELK